VTTPDTSGDTRVTRTPLDAALGDLLAFEPRPELVARLDERVNLAAATLGAASPRVGRRFRSTRRRKVLGLLAAAVILAGAGGALGLYEGMGAGLEVGFGLQLDRSVAVGATEVRDGYRVTIDRAYIDAERLMLAIVVTDELKRPEVDGLMAMYAVVTDQAGEWQGAGGATSRPIGQWSAANVLWRLAPVAPLPAGTQRLHVVVPHIFVRDNTIVPPVSEDQEWNPYRQVNGPWTFDIELAVDGGAAVATPDAVHTIAGVPVTLEQVIVGPSAIRIEMGVDDPSRATWAFSGQVRRGNQTFPIVIGKLGTDHVELQADGGAQDASGDWSLVISEATRIGFGDAEEERLAGPWTFDFHIP
jgi:hypothetical protein